MFNTKDYETFNSQLIHMVNEEMDMFMIISHLPKIFNIKNKSHLACMSLLYINSFLLTMFSDKICYFHNKKKTQMIYTFYWFKLFPDMLYTQDSKISGYGTKRIFGVCTEITGKTCSSSHYTDKWRACQELLKRQVEEKL